MDIPGIVIPLALADFNGVILAHIHPDPDSLHAAWLGAGVGLCHRTGYRINLFDRRLRIRGYLSHCPWIL